MEYRSIRHWYEDREGLWVTVQCVTTVRTVQAVCSDLRFTALASLHWPRMVRGAFKGKRDSI